MVGRSASAGAFSGISCCYEAHIWHGDRWNQRGRLFSVSMAASAWENADAEDEEELQRRPMTWLLRWLDKSQLAPAFQLIIVGNYCVGTGSVLKSSTWKQWKKVLLTDLFVDSLVVSYFKWRSLTGQSETNSRLIQNGDHQSCQIRADSKAHSSNAADVMDESLLHCLINK